MQRLAAVERYLSAQMPDASPVDDGTEARARPFITISRQAGAGGHLLSDALLAQFARQGDDGLFGGWQVFDKKLCEIVAEDSVFGSSMEALLAEEYRTRRDAFFSQILSPTIDQDVLMLRVFKVVRAVASIGKSIIVGRAGSEVTRDMDGGVSVRLVAPEEDCIRRVMEYYDIDERSAREKARHLDASRARLLKAHFRVDVTDPTRYDAVWNTGEVSIDAIAESIAVLVRSKVARSQAGT